MRVSNDLKEKILGSVKVHFLGVIQHILRNSTSRTTINHLFGKENSRTIGQTYAITHKKVNLDVGWYLKIAPFALMQTMPPQYDQWHLAPPAHKIK
ncbi:hypothetical protein XcuCFBP2542_15405 [Xanthomonas cucurbitae]|uniref:Uncharacterized protein n=1 Tax=Xanthomonas cucurbitae TaxID=56453 RepID=A0A2S7DKI4_9XANT|nr:hypothetical protein XcuCFBP2542_15405 [Xanthomonas cucurbitae]QHG85746.1 hypothetical protein EBN15_00840 [Xanthomonas cucurbitae]